MKATHYWDLLFPSFKSNSSYSLAAQGVKFLPIKYKPNNFFIVVVVFFYITILSCVTMYYAFPP